MSTQGTIDYQSLKQKTGGNWKSATQELRDHPQYPQQVSETVEQQYSKLDPKTQQALDQMPQEAKTSFFHLIGTLNQMGQTNKEQSEQVGQFISQCIQQSTSSTSSSR